ncbi:MAG TPA: hypothetical protein VGS23_00365, partial [Thermoplasmata archaeon]|nr:hypothetical protein [Thermoplasmata archaeon]
RSQSSGTYVKEYVTLNNSTTLTAIPVLLTVAASSCRWVTVVNLTTASSPASTFTNVEYANVSTTNLSASMTLDAGPAHPAFKICGASSAWINFKTWTFGVYDFSFVSLGANGTATVTYGVWPGTTTAPAAITAKVSSSGLLVLKVPSNLTFTIALPLAVDGSQTCSDFNQVCSFNLYSFKSATNAVASLTNTTGSIVFGKGYAALATATWSNWTVTYTNSSIQNNTATGAFFAEVGSFWTNWIAAFAAYWVFAIAIIVILAGAGLVYSDRGRRHERKR